MYILDMNVQILKSMYSNYLQKKPIQQNEWLVWLVDFQRFSFNIFIGGGGGQKCTGCLQGKCFKFKVLTNWFLFQRDLQLVPIVRVQCIFEKYDFLIFHILVTFLKTFLAFFFKLVIPPSYKYIKLECVFEKGTQYLVRGVQGHILRNRIIFLRQVPPPFLRLELNNYIEVLWCVCIYVLKNIYKL